ncbi:uncharacterized protein LOC141525486 [Cotesia typhae]|uniref:uncharacterized protein LOC141525486 n=1 Tax=Cotesia typhae TaxID=2053667 RepID=UPI003D682B26
MEITCNIEKARKFLWVRVGEGAIQTPSCGIRSIYMSKDGVDFEKIEDLESIFDNSNTSELPNCSPQSMMYGDGASYNSSDDETTAEIEVVPEESPKEATVETGTKNHGQKKRKMEELKSTDYFVKCNQGYICIMYRGKSASLNLSINLEKHLLDYHKNAL